MNLEASQIEGDTSDGIHGGRIRGFDRKYQGKSAIILLLSFYILGNALAQASCLATSS